MKQGYITINSKNEMYYEINGNENGIPLLFLHGGPGSGISDKLRLNVDLNKYMLIEYDQRGCGKSSKSLDLSANNTINLVLQWLQYL